MVPLLEHPAKTSMKLSMLLPNPETQIQEYLLVPERNIAFTQDKGIRYMQELLAACMMNTR